MEPADSLDADSLGDNQPHPPGVDTRDSHASLDWLASVETIEHEATEDRYRADYDPTQDKPSLAVVAVLAAAAGVDPIELPPLNHSVDTEALDQLFSPPKSTGQQCTFTVDSFAVTVSGDGTIDVSRPRSDS